MNEERPPLPPATFEFLVFSLTAQAEMQMGLIQFGDEEAPEPDLDLARHSIDMLGVLQAKTKGNLSVDEQQLLDNSVAELRFHFAEASKGWGGVLVKPDEPRIIIP